MTDNIDLVLPFLKFDSVDDFYYLQILQRKKENPQLGSNSRVIKNYYIRSQRHLLERYDEIKELCKKFNARASIRLNKRSFEKVAYKAMVNVANSCANREFQFIRSSYDRACGLGHNEPKGNKKWILDVDEVMSEHYFNMIHEYINGCLPEGEKILELIPSKSGSHIITKPFDLREFREVFPDIEIHKDNPTNLFIP